MLFVLLLIVISVASMTSIRWISPTIHLDTQFGASRDLSLAVMLGAAVLLIYFFSIFLSGRTIRTLGWPLNSGLILLVSALILSTLFADDKAIALYSGAGLLIGLTVMFCAYKLSDKTWKINLAIIVLISLGATFAAKTWMRELYEFDQTWKHYYQTRDEFWAQRGKSLDDSEVKLFEARLKSRDNGGFFFQGNLGGAYLAVVLMVSLTMIAKRVREKGKPFYLLWLIAQIILSGFILSGLILTFSKGAIIALILAMIAITILWLMQDRIRKHFRLAVVLCLLIIVLTGGSVIAYGLENKTLPTLSMAYRWQYWTAGWKMFKDHPLTGVGPGSFGQYYLKYKLPQAEEEVSSPHNFIVQSFCEYGLIGGLGLILLIVGIFYQIAKNSVMKYPRQNDERQNDETKSSAPINLLYLWLGLFAAIFIFNQTNLPGLIYLVAEYLPYMLIFPLAFVICSMVGDKFENIDNSEPPVLFLAGALIVFVLGNLVNFSLFEPSTQMLFFFIAGITLSASRNSNAEDIPKSAAKKKNVQTIAFIVILNLYSYFILIPAVRAEQAAYIETSQPEKSCKQFKLLAKRYSYDAYLSAQAGNCMLARARSSDDPVATIKRAAEFYVESCKRNKSSWKMFAKLAQCDLLLSDFDRENKFTWLEQAESLMEHARTLAPRSRSLAKTLGLIYFNHAMQQHPPSKKIIAAARKNLNEAMQLNDALPKNSIRRFSKTTLKQINAAFTFINRW